jgi:23S rRNA (adenine1618-N6)-methyltransferase
MIGRKLSLKVLTAKLWTLGVAAVRTTEFVQGHTSRWGLAWSFTVPPKMESSKTSVQIKSNVSFMLEGLRHGCSAVDVLQGLISQLQSNGVLCMLDLSSFSINVSILGLSFNSSLHPVHSYVYVALNCICQSMKVTTLVGGKLEVYFIIK